MGTDSPETNGNVGARPEPTPVLRRVVELAADRHPEDDVLQSFLLAYYAELPEFDADDRREEDLYAVALALLAAACSGDDADDTDPGAEAPATEVPADTDPGAAPGPGTGPRLQRRGARGLAAPPGLPPPGPPGAGPRRGAGGRRGPARPGRRP